MSCIEITDSANSLRWPNELQTHFIDDLSLENGVEMFNDKVRESRRDLHKPSILGFGGKLHELKEKSSTWILRQNRIFSIMAIEFKWDEARAACGIDSAYITGTFS